MRIRIWATLIVISSSAMAVTSPADAAPVISGVAMPSRPQLDASAFPGCATDYARVARFETQVQLVQDCINDLEIFNNITLPDYVGQMRRYVKALQIISANAIKSRTMPQSDKQAIADYVRDETLASDPNNGGNFTRYRLYLARYKGQLKSLLSVRARQQFPSN